MASSHVASPAAAAGQPSQSGQRETESQTRGHVTPWIVDAYVYRQLENNSFGGRFFLHVVVTVFFLKLVFFLFLGNGL